MVARLLRRARSALVAAIYPEPLSATLASLKRAGLIEGYEERPREVLIWGDLLAVETRLRLADHGQEEIRTPVDGRAEYFRHCRQFMHTGGFRALAAQNRAIFRMHANGASQSAIALRLGVSPMKVRVAIRGARLAAQLPPTTSIMPRGGGLGRPPMPESSRPRCGMQDCGKPAESRGLCNLHYQRERRRRNVT